MEKQRELLAAFAIKYNGNYDDIFFAIKNRQYISKTSIDYYLGNLSCKYITILDNDYPKQLMNVHKPPFVLFYYGDINLIKNYNRSVSIVGSRNCSDYGIKATSLISKSVAKSLIIISGMAKGIDSVAHKTCLKNGGKTVAVLGSGIDYIYPKENDSLYKEIKLNGLVISEYPNNVAPSSTNFPFRNRLIAALSKVLLVTEANDRSGTLTSINHALEANTIVCCIPYPFNNSSLCNKLIKEGARLINSATDLLEEYE